MLKLTANKKWIAFALCCLSFILTAMQDSNYLTSILFFPLHFDSANFAPIPTLIMAALFFAALVFAAYNKKIIPVVLSAPCLLYGFHFSISSSHGVYYGIAILLANIIVIAYIFSKKASFWKKAPFIIVSVGVLIIAVSVALSFYSIRLSSGTILNSTSYWKHWGSRQDTCCWWEILGHLYPLEICWRKTMMMGLVPTSALFPISIGILYFVLAAGIGLQPKRQHEFEGLEVTVSANKAVGLKNSDDGVEEIKATPSESNVSGHNILAEEKIIAEELRQLKALLDDGCITQEEFDTKKKQLLGM